METMTPKEEAKKLVDKFTVIGLQQRNEGIQCALICVDKLIKAFEFQRFEFGDDYNTTYSHYKKVKEEIEKL
jgi:hypothetical protein